MSDKGEITTRAGAFDAIRAAQPETYKDAGGCYLRWNDGPECLCFGRWVAWLGDRAELPIRVAKPKPRRWAAPGGHMVECTEAESRAQFHGFCLSARSYEALDRCVKDGLFNFPGETIDEHRVFLRWEADDAGA